MDAGRLCKEPIQSEYIISRRLYPYEIFIPGIKPGDSEDDVHGYSGIWPDSNEKFVYFSGLTHR